MFRNLSRRAAVNLYFSCASNSWGDAQKSSIANVMMRTRFFCVGLWTLGSGEFRSVNCEMRIIEGTLHWTMYRLRCAGQSVNGEVWTTAVHMNSKLWTVNDGQLTVESAQRVSKLGKLQLWDLSEMEAVFCERQTANHEVWILHWGRNNCLESSMEIIAERVSCKLRMVSCESWIGVENGCLESFVEPNWSLLKALWSTWGAVLEPRGSL